MGITDEDLRERADCACNFKDGVTHYEMCRYPDLRAVRDEARAEALEEAAVVADDGKHSSDCGVFCCTDDICTCLPDRIRALKAKEGVAEWCEKKAGDYDDFKRKTP